MQNKTIKICKIKPSKYETEKHSNSFIDPEKGSIVGRGGVTGKPEKIYALFPKI